MKNIILFFCGAFFVLGCFALHKLLCVTPDTKQYAQNIDINDFLEMKLIDIENENGFFLVSMEVTNKSPYEVEFGIKGSSNPMPPLLSSLGFSITVPDTAMGYSVMIHNKDQAQSFVTIPLKKQSYSKSLNHENTRILYFWLPGQLHDTKKDLNSPWSYQFTHFAYKKNHEWITYNQVFVLKSENYKD